MKKIPKFPTILGVLNSDKFNKMKFDNWRNEVIEIIEKQIKKDSKKMPLYLASYMDIRPFLKALKSDKK